MTQITEDTFEQVLHIFREAQEIDLHGVTFIDPYGMVSLFEIRKLLKSKGVQKTLYLPESEEVLGCLERMGFFRFTDGYFTLKPSQPQVSEKYLRNSRLDVLLEITPIEKPDDIH